MNHSKHKRMVNKHKKRQRARNTRTKKDKNPLARTSIKRKKKAAPRRTRRK